MTLIRQQNQANLVAVVLLVVVAAIVNHSFIQNLILPWYQGHATGQTGRLEREQRFEGWENKKDKKNKMTK